MLGKLYDQENIAVLAKQIERRIMMVRGQKVMLDQDLALVSWLRLKRNMTTSSRLSLKSSPNS